MRDLYVRRRFCPIRKTLRLWEVYDGESCLRGCYTFVEAVVAMVDIADSSCELSLFVERALGEGARVLRVPRFVLRMVVRRELGVLFHR